MMAARHLAAIAATTPDAPYAPEVTREQLLDAMREILRLGATGTHAVWNVPRAILQREETHRAYIARREALRLATLAHDLKATPKGDNHLKACPCATCAPWRLELRRLYAAQQQHK